MQISIIQAILIGTLYYLTNNGVSWLAGLGSISTCQPIYAGTIVGSVLGRPVESCIMGATINTPYLGFVDTGGTLLTDPGIGDAVGTALALGTNTMPQVTISVAVPFGVMGTMVQTLRQVINIHSVHQTDKYAVIGDIRKMAFWQLAPTQLFGYAATVIPRALPIYFGVPVTQGLLDMLAGKPLHILSMIGGILPTIGIAMIIRMLNTRNGILISFTLEFSLETYSGLSMSVVSIFAAIATHFYDELKFGETGNKE